MFCGCALSFGDQPNTHTCPVCLAHPGTLPVVQRAGGPYGLKIAACARLRCGSTVDLPPQELLLSRPAQGLPDQPVRPPARRQRAARRGPHPPRPPGGGRRQDDPRRGVGPDPRLGASLVDFNRGGTPLVEIVTEPDLRSAAQAREWAQLLRTTIRQLGVSDVNMEEGSLRCRRQRLGPARRRRSSGQDRAEEHEQLPLPRARDRGRARTPARAARRGRGGRSRRPSLRPRDGSLTPLRSKEYAHDYRYFPEPDLVPIVPTEEMLTQAREALPELPAARRERYLTEAGLSRGGRHHLAFQAELGEYFERALGAADGASAEVDRQLGYRRAGAALREAGEEDPLASKVDPRGGGRAAGLVEAKPISHGAASRCWGHWSPRAATRRRSSRARAWPRSPTLASWRRSSTAAIEAEPDAAEQVRARQREGDRPDHGRRDAGDPGPGGWRRGSRR